MKTFQEFNKDEQLDEGAMGNIHNDVCEKLEEAHRILMQTVTMLKKAGIEPELRGQISTVNFKLWDIIEKL